MLHPGHALRGRYVRVVECETLPGPRRNSQRVGFAGRRHATEYLRIELGDLVDRNARRLGDHIDARRVGNLNQVVRQRRVWIDDVESELPRLFGDQRRGNQLRNVVSRLTPKVSAS